MDAVTIFTDGSANNITGSGGWCAIIQKESTLIELSGWVDSTTSNRMELLAAIEGLNALFIPHKVRLVSDSTYMIKTLRHKWYETWFAQNQTHRPNLDLWESLASLVKYHDVDFVKVKGHSNHYWNDRCDYLAGEARLNQITSRNETDDFRPSEPCGIISNEKECRLFHGHLSDCYFSNRKQYKWEI